MMGLKQGSRKDAERNFRARGIFTPVLGTVAGFTNSWSIIPEFEKSAGFLHSCPTIPDFEKGAGDSWVARSDVTVGCVSSSLDVTAGSRSSSDLSGS